MKQEIKPGKYIVAVSGGVDSVVLLNMLSKNNDLHLVVAHFDHGMRPHSSRDRIFVQNLANTYDLPFEYAEGSLGKDASEEVARRARYLLLNKVKEKYHASAIITAHHQDDIIETQIMNLLRGTGRKGLSSLQSNQQVIRPLLSYSKQDILNYAVSHNLDWVEDETNSDESYTRNWIRHNIVPKLSTSQRRFLINLQTTHATNNKVIDEILDTYIHPESQEILQKKYIVILPHDLALELLAHWLRKNNIRDVDSKTLNKLLIGVKTLKPGKKIPVKKEVYVIITQDEILIKKPGTI